MASGSEEDLFRIDQLQIPGTQPPPYEGQGDVDMDREAAGLERERQLLRERDAEQGRERQRLRGQDVEREMDFGAGPRRYPWERDLFQVRRLEKPKVFPAMYDGNTNWVDYEVHFSMVAEINGWDDRSKAVFLAASLRGSAQSVLSDLDERSRHSFRQLRAALNRRFGQDNQTELFRAQLRLRRKKADETLPQMAQDIRRLVRLAFPTADEHVREALAKEGFLDALVDTDLKWQVVQARPPTLDEAARVAVELEAFIQADKQRSGRGGRPYKAMLADVDKGPSPEIPHRPAEPPGSRCMKLDSNEDATTLELLVKQVQELAKNMESMKINQPGKNEREGQSQDTRRKFNRNRKNYNCWTCGEVGHFSSECSQNTEGNSNTANYPSGRNNGNANLN